MTNPLTDARHTVETMVDRIDARAALETAHGYTFGAICGLLCGFSLRESAAKLGVPPTTLARKLKALAGEVAT